MKDANIRCRVNNVQTMDEMLKYISRKIQKKKKFKKKLYYITSIRYTITIN